MDYSNLEEKFVSSETIFDGHVVHLEKLTVTMPDNKTAYREIIRHVGAAAVVAVDKEKRVAMVHQYRAPLGRVTLEVPAGKRDTVTDDFYETAVRELREETGFTAQKWDHLGSIATTPGFCDEIIALYLARDLQKGETQFDEDEFLDIEMIPYSELLQQIAQGKIQDCKTVCALLMAQKYLS